MDRYNEMVDEISETFAPAITRLTEIADKYGQNRNELIIKAAAVFAETVFSGDFTDYGKEEP